MGLAIILSSTGIRSDAIIQTGSGIKSLALLKLISSEARQLLESPETRFETNALHTHNRIELGKRANLTMGCGVKPGVTGGGGGRVII